MDAAQIRKDFPIFQNQEEPLIYLDNAATSQKPGAVIERMSRYYLYENANIHRGDYPLSRRADRLYEQVREQVKDWIGAEYKEEIVFTKGSTEAVNLAASALFEEWIRPGDNVVVTELEHSSNYFPWKKGCERIGAQLRTAMAELDGSLRPESVEVLIDSRTRLVAVTAMSNVTGFRPELDSVIKAAHRAGALVLIDGAQAVVHGRLSVQEMDCDFLCFSGHKLYGPMGIGVLYGKGELLRRLPPYLYGGDMVEVGDGGAFTYKTEPGKYEAGTQNIAGALGLGAALTYLEEHNFDELLLHETELARYGRERFKTVKGLRLPGPDILSPVILLEAEGLGAYDLGILLGMRGIGVRCGAHCAYPLLRRMGKESLCRISLAFYNTKEEIDRTAEALEEILKGGAYGNQRKGT